MWVEDERRGLGGDGWRWRVLEVSLTFVWCILSEVVNLNGNEKMNIAMLIISKGYAMMRYDCCWKDKTRADDCRHGV